MGALPTMTKRGPRQRAVASDAKIFTPYAEDQQPRAATGAAYKDAAEAARVRVPPSPIQRKPIGG